MKKTENGELTKTDVETAEILNDFFQTLQNLDIQIMNLFR